MPKFHQRTKHSYSSVRANPQFLQWDTQPRSYKIYPKFYPTFSSEKLELIGKVTQKLYSLRVNPSAGGLYPCEIYLQARGYEGFVDGIYHYEGGNFRLLQDVERDGVEFYFGKKRQRGLIFLVSAVYFRSSWKYRDRSIRYILLDSGHQLGSIALALKSENLRVEFGFDKLALNREFGFRDDEMFTVALIDAEQSDREVSRLKQSMPYIAGCDYLETNSFIEEAYRESAEFSDETLVLPNFFTEDLESAILNRRSIRAFRREQISRDEFEFILSEIFEFAREVGIELFYTVHRVSGVQNGLYRMGELIREGEFEEKSGYLGLEQKLGRDSAFTLYFTSSEEQKYQKVAILSGFIAHIIYIRAELKSIGCSGIGAYYDDEVKEFLGTKNNILYMLAVGR
jgi:SagB-type dehydrogenase family enzyme